MDAARTEERRRKGSSKGGWEFELAEAVPEQKERIMGIFPAHCSLLDDTTGTLI